ncbi:hypothetical protein MHYP_G00213590 [Metynnis hypsauchen]
MWTAVLEQFLFNGVQYFNLHCAFIQLNYHIVGPCLRKQGEKYGTDAALISTLSDVQLGATTTVSRVSAVCGNSADQLDRELAKCRWFSIQCDESVDSSSTAHQTWSSVVQDWLKTLSG